MTVKRISYIDMAKGIGILLVVLGHFSFTPSTVNLWISSFHMPLFFLLSGILLSHTNAHTKEMGILIKKKARTILVPYFYFCILSIFFNAILDSASFYLPNALMQMLSFYGITVLWFLPALFFGEIVFLFIRKHTSLAVTALISASICLLAVFMTHAYYLYYPLNPERPLSVLGSYLIAVIVRSGIAVTFLALGYFSHYFFFKNEYPALVYILLAVLSLGLNIYLGFKNGTVDLNYMVFKDYRIYFSAAFFGSMFVICLCRALPPCKPLIAAGKHSLIIMATHMNCRLLGICYAIGNLALSFFPFIGHNGFVLICIAAMIILEVLAVHIINRFFPFLIGVSKHS